MLLKTWYLSQCLHLTCPHISHHISHVRFSSGAYKTQICSEALARFSASSKICILLVTRCMVKGTGVFSRSRGVRPLREWLAMTLFFSENPYVAVVAGNRESAEVCWNCFRKVKTLVCSQCKVAWYCGKTWQANDWKAGTAFGRVPALRRARNRTELHGNSKSTTSSYVWSLECCCDIGRIGENREKNC